MAIEQRPQTGLQRDRKASGLVHPEQIRGSLLHHPQWREHVSYFSSAGKTRHSIPATRGDQRHRFSHDPAKVRLAPMPN